MKEYFKINKKHLLLLAGIVWGFAGFNILRIGVIAYEDSHEWWQILISACIFGLFQWMVFGKMVRRHTQRINQYEESQQYFFKFFDSKGFCMMAFMMSLGITLRMSNICPDIFIAVFYSGLGASLLTAGILFLINYLKELTQEEITNTF